jgi:hypothetical protein
MPEFKGFDDWIPIFNGGKQTDSMGREHDGNALIEKAVANFNAAKHEPPAVIGHPKDNAPAYGWVEGLKKESGLLFAKFKQVQPDFVQMVKDGLFKKRSAAFYPDGTLRHVAFLGAQPPAVKGLANLHFSEGGENMSFEFNESKDPGEFLHQKVMELLNSSAKFSDQGVPITGTLTYGNALDMVSTRYPEIAREYLAGTRGQ